MIRQISEVQEILYDPICESIFATIKTDSEVARGFYIDSFNIVIEFCISLEEWERMKRWNICNGLLENAIAEINYDEKLNKPKSEQALIELL